MKKSGFFVVLLILMSSCFGDIDKDISTDLQFEGNEIFNISLSLEESLFFPFQSIDYFRISESLAIPGCPDVTIDEANKKVTLTFSAKKECVNSLYVPRSGKIHLQYISNSVLESIVQLDYEEYTVRGMKIEGKREFKNVNSSLNPNRREETFQDLLIIESNQSSSRINGSYIHQLAILNGILTGFSSTGQLDGRNIAGRPLKMTQSTPKNYIVSCIEIGFSMPTQGSENWQISRSETQATRHSLSYELEIDCLSKATITLDDGRIMVFRLTE